jgi:catechol 2,3-dioxygenase-like lactoylglutathione lyase family enzyme
VADNSALVWVVLLLIGAVVPMVLAARITDRKGRGAGLGIVLGFVLGWIGVLIAVALGDRRGRVSRAGAGAGRAVAAGSPGPPVESGGVIGLDHVQVAAPPGREFDARRFYGGLLGLEEIEKPSLLAERGGVWFRIGAQELHVGVDSGPVAEGRSAHPALRVADPPALEEIAERLEAAGYDVTWADDVERPGARRFHCRDPFGNRLELFASAADARGRTRE